MSESESPHLSDLYETLTILMSRGHSPEQAHSLLERQQEALYGRHPDLLEERITALNSALCRIRDDQNRVKFLQRRAVRFDRTQWYLGPSPEDSLWARMRARLEDQGRNEEEIRVVDADSTSVVGLLDNPTGATFSTKGLVVGHVQSGKTGNIAAVINKAADTPFKFFLVMSGMTDQLRHQTQVRLDRDVVGLDPARWMQWTAHNTGTTNGDFSERATGGFSFDSRNQLAVIKKNAAVLRRLLAKLRNTNEATLRNTPFLIVDDECDQASVNSARYADAMTRINELIRQLLRELPRAAYVGYTATPFANVLIDPAVPEDLYPRDFIYALERPEAYFGAAELFGRGALMGEYHDGRGDGYDMIREIPDVEIPLLRPPGKKTATVTVSISPSLESAIRYFIMVIAARRNRGQADRHNTMLLHTSVLNSVHSATEAIVRPYVERLALQLRNGEESTLTTMERQWQEEQERVLSEEFDRTPVSFQQIKPLLADAVGDIRVHVENWTSTDRLDYSEGPRSYLVIGGNVLARGLTLEGLSVSYFLRSSSQYDTLMQMGRWFGYRSGFEDLPRVWVEERVRDVFFDLATVEAEIRRDIARYAVEQVRPTEFAVRIRKLPGMMITAPAKMRSAVPVQVGYAGTHIQTFRFRHHDRSWLLANWEAGAGLLASIDATAPVVRDVAVDKIVRFLQVYQPHFTHVNLNPEFLIDYIRKASHANQRMAQWTVALVQGTGGESELPLGPLGKVRTIIRSAERSSGQDASVKAVMSRRDVLVDFPDVLSPPDASWDELKSVREQRRGGALLVLYPIEALSRPARTAGADVGRSREPLAAAADVLGYAIVFPSDDSPAGTYVSARIRPEEAEATDDLQEGDRIPDMIVNPLQDGPE